MKNRSIWSDFKISKNYKKLNKDIKTNTLIIGGGITGINILYNLKNTDVTLVERGKIAMATTLNTTGKLTYLQDNIYNNIIENYDEDKAKEYLKSQLDALDIIKNIIKNEKIDCDLVKSKSYVFTTLESDIENIKILKNFLESNNICVEENTLKLIDNLYSVSVNDTYLFNPIKYIDGLLKKINNNIYEHTNIINIESKNNKYVCYTEDGYKISANYVVIATNYPNFILPYMFPLKSHIEKSYVMAYKNKIDNISLISYKAPSTSIRNYNDYTIEVSNSHISCNDTDDNKNFKELTSKIKNKPDYIWSNNDIYTNDYIPYIGYIKENMLIATGFNTWGMLNSVISGKVISDLITKNSSEYEELFYPKRFLKISKIFKDSLLSIKGYIKGYTDKNDKITYDNIDGIDVMIYKKDNKEYIVKRKCPHLKCNLIFNEKELTFDCPCHSSRFDLEGTCIKGPSKYNIKINNKNETK